MAGARELQRSLQLDRNVNTVVVRMESFSPRGVWGEGRELKVDLEV